MTVIHLFVRLKNNRSPTFMKLITVLPEERVVGLHMIGIGCDEMYNVQLLTH